MKRTLTLLLAITMILACSVNVFAAEKAATNPVRTFMSNNSGVLGFLYDSEKGYVDLDGDKYGSGGSEPYFGDTLYIPLVNENYNSSSGSVKTLYTAYKNALDEKDDANSTLQAKTTAYNSASTAYNTALENYNAAVTALNGVTVSDTNYTTLYNAKESAEAAKNSAASAKSSAETAYNNAKDDYDTACANYVAKKSAYDAANKYIFVNESVAVQSVKITVSGLTTLTKKFINPDEISIVKMKAYSENYNGLGKNDLTTNRIYFLAIPIGTYTKLTDLTDPLEGTIRVRKSTGNDANEFDLTFEFYYFATHKTADIASSSYFTTVTKTKQVFEPGVSFEQTEDFEFRFAEDPNSAFVVDTSRQIKSIELSFDIEYPDDEYDYLMEHTGYGIDVSFYNGYSSQNFTKTGTLYLYWGDEESRAYVYRINNDDAKTLTLIENAKLDTDYYYGDGCYAVQTNNLGRYLISSKLLSKYNIYKLTDNLTADEIAANEKAEAEALAQAEAEAQELAEKEKLAQEEAKRIAEEAKRIAEEAKKVAEEAKALAEEAVKISVAANSVATESISEASSANLKAESAISISEDAIELIPTDGAGAKLLALDAQSEANAAKKYATSAESKAYEAKRIADADVASKDTKDVQQEQHAEEKDEELPMVAWVGIIGGTVLVVILIGVFFYTRGNGGNGGNAGSNSGYSQPVRKNNKRRML